MTIDPGTLLGPTIAYRDSVSFVTIKVSDFWVNIWKKNSGNNSSDGVEFARRVSCWTLCWDQLSDDQKAAAEYLGWTAESWNNTPYYWPFPRGITWWNMTKEVRSSLEVLGESAESWAAWG